MSRFDEITKRFNDAAFAVDRYRVYAGDSTRTGGAVYKEGYMAAVSYAAALESIIREMQKGVSYDDARNR